MKYLILLLPLVLTGCFASYRSLPVKTNSLSVEVNAQQVICEDFIGFGAEWDSHSYPHFGVTGNDYDVIRKRLEWMRLPAARIMMLSRWCYKGNDHYDWASEEMKALYHNLDICQQLGTTVFLTDWGCEREWLRCPDVSAVEDPKYAEIIATYLEYLINEKGYDCIKYFIMVNEPNLKVKDWLRWKKGIENVYARFQERGLTNHVILTGSDHSNNDQWHKKAVDQLQEQLGAYDIHRYARDSDVRYGKLFDYFKKSWGYARQHDPAAKIKPFIVGEAGLKDEDRPPKGNSHIDSVYYGIFMADYAVQAVNAGSASVLAWMLDDNSHKGFSWGMWSNKQKGMKLKPWFYPWSLLCRTFPAGSHIVQTTAASRDVRILAGYYVDESLSKKQWTFCLVNRADKPINVRLQVKENAGVEMMSRYVYSNTSARVDGQGFPVAMDYQSYDLSAGEEVRCGAESVVILSSIK